MQHFFVLLLIFTISIPSWALRFHKACDPGDTLTVGAVGDVLLHGPLQKQGFDEGFESLWSDLTPWIQGADIFYANFEGPSAPGITKNGKTIKNPDYFNGVVYTGYPLFNYPNRVINALKESGVDILSVANNHALDRGSKGVLLTREACEINEMPCPGTRSNSNENFYSITHQKNWSIAWIACTFSTNGISDKDDLVLDCFSSGRVSQLISELKDQVDAVIITPHWGDEYQLKPNKQQMSFAKQWLEEGALAIIGTHPHVPQPWEKYTTKGGEEKFILYSSGNFVSNQSSTAKQTGLMLFLGLSRNQGRAWVNGVRYLPLYMNRKPYSVVASNWIETPSDAQKASLSLAKKMYGDERIVEPGEAVLTNVECSN